MNLPLTQNFHCVFRMMLRPTFGFVTHQLRDTDEEDHGGESSTIQRMYPLLPLKSSLSLSVSDYLSFPACNPAGWSEEQSSKLNRRP